MAVKAIRLNSRIRKVALLLTGAFLLLAAFFVLKWQIASAAVATVEQKELAEVLIKLAPDDPQIHLRLAHLLEKSFKQEDIERAIHHYKRTVELSPYDYRFWLALGLAIERNQGSAEAEKFLKRAVELAPNYAQVHWILGNNFLRQRKRDEALQEIKTAIEANNAIAEGAMATVWQVLDGDLDTILEKIGDSGSVRAALSLVLAREKRLDEAFLIWSTLSDQEKRDVFRGASDKLLDFFYQEKRFHLILKAQRDLGISDANFDSIKNGGFEESIVDRDKIFDWRVSDGFLPQIGISRNQKYSGEQSLLMIFDSPTQKDLRFIEQTVAVFPNSEYTLKLFVRSDLESQNSVRWDIIDAVEGKILGQTEFLPKKSDWMLIKAKFKTSDKTEAITIRLSYPSCLMLGCPVLGKIWFDDFTLEK